MGKVLVVSNCATQGLVAGLQLLCPELVVTGYEIGTARAAPQKLRQDAAQSDILVLLPGVAPLLGAELVSKKTIVTVPTFFFSGYHPDTVYIENAAGQQLKSEYGAYHSMICFAAHRAGLSLSEALRLYRGKVYQDLGYFEEWDQQKSLLLDSFRSHHIELSDLFLSWVRGGCFMYTVNHPEARCIFDLSRQVTRRIGATPLAFDVPPRDTLVVGSIFPCYPEIAEACGTQGSLLFKIDNQNRVLTLPQYIKLCFDYYDSQTGTGMRPAKAFADKMARFEERVLGRIGA